MNCKVVASKHATDPYCPIYRAAYLILLLWCGTLMLAQNPGGPTSSAPASEIRATHLLGLEGASNNAKGELSIKYKELQFRKRGRPAVQVNIGSIQDVSLGEESREVGGFPMTLGKAGTPYGGGRVVSLFAHKKYDTVTLLYQDTNGGFHGAIFQLDKGQGQVLKNELVAKGARVALAENHTAKQSITEVKNESK